MSSSSWNMMGCSSRTNMGFLLFLPLSPSCSRCQRMIFAPAISSLLSSSLTKLVLHGCGDEIERFSDQQEEALELLAALEQLQLNYYKNLQCLPATGLCELPSLKRLEIWCLAIRSLPKDGLPNSLQKLCIYGCLELRTLPKNGLPNSLQKLVIQDCSAIRTLPKNSLPNSLQKIVINRCQQIRKLPKDGLPSSLQQLQISRCPSIQTLPKAGLPRSLQLLDVKDCESEELKGRCRKLIGTIPIVKV